MNRPACKRISCVRNTCWLLLGLILLLDFTIRWRLRDLPLERDEGEYAYAGQLFLQGLSPYDHAYNLGLKLPGTWVAYAGIMAVLGQTASAIHIGVILVNLVSTILVFILARRICGDAAGVAGAGAFALLSLVPTTLGLAAHATHFVILPALGGILLLQDPGGHASSRRVFMAGLLLGLAVLMKQTGAAFGLFGAGWILRQQMVSSNKQWKLLVKPLGWLVLGGLVPLVFTGVIILAVGDFSHFWFWTFQYATAHGAILGFGNGLRSMMTNIAVQFSASPGLWGMATLGLILVFFAPFLKGWRFFLAGFSLCSFLAVCPGWYFRGHYFIQLLPAAGLLVAVACRGMTEFFARQSFNLAPPILPAAVLSVAMASSLIQWSDIYFRLSPAQAIRAIYGTNPFLEAIEISRYLAAHCRPSDTIAVIGSEPEIYFYSQRHSASGYICVYPLVEPQPYAATMQDEMIQEIEHAKPAYAVFVNIQGSWQQSTARTANKITGWWNGFSQNYQLVGIMDRGEDGSANFFWDDQISSRTNTRPADILILRRK